MAEVQEQQTQNNIIDDSILKEIEKVASIEKGLKFVQDRQGDIEKSVTKINETLKSGDNQNVIKEDDEDTSTKDDKNVINPETINSQLTTIEKKRYEQIGKEFLRGASLQFAELEKAQRIKEKMITKVQKDDEKKKAEIDNSSQKKKSKMGFFKKLAIILGSLGILYTIFKDKIEDLFPKVDVAFTGLDSKTDSVFDKMGVLFFNIFGVSFGGAFSNLIQRHLPSLLNNFFFYVLPAAMERSVLAAMSNFSASARERYESGNVSFESNLETAKRKYDEAAARRNASEDFLKMQSDDYSDTQRLSAKSRLQSNAFVMYDTQNEGQNIRDLVSRIYGNTLFGIDGLNNSDEVKEYLFGQNHPLTKTLISVIEKNREDLQKLAEDGLTKDEITNNLVPILAKAAGITNTSDARYKKLTQDALASFGADASQAGGRLKGLMGVVTTYENVISSEQSAIMEQHKRETAQETTAALGSIQFDGGRKEIQLLTESLNEANIAQEVSDFYTTIMNTFKNPESLAEKYVNGAGSLARDMFKTFLNNAFDLFDSIIDNIPIFFRSQGTMSSALGLFSSLTDDLANLRDVNLSEQSHVLSKGIKAMVLVSLNLNGSVIKSIRDISNGRLEILNKLQNTNNVLIDIIEIVNQKHVISGNVSDLTDKLNEYMSSTSTKIGAQISMYNDRITNIENYLEANDVDGDTSGKDFVLQAKPTA